MKEPKTLYRIAIDHAARQYETFNSEEEATTFAREMIEADGNHVFMGGKRGCNGLLVLRWMEWADAEPHVISKTIGIANQKELNEYAKWLRAEQDKEAAAHWEKVCQKIISYSVQQKMQAKKKQTKAVKWVD